MRVLLISAYLGRKGQELTSFPLGLAYLSAALQDHECIVLDPNVMERPFAEMQMLIEKTEPDIVALSLRNIDTTQSWDPFSYFEQFVSMLRLVKRIRPEAKIVVGGTGFSMFPREIMTRLPEIDYGIFLEGELSLPRLLQRMDHPERVRGLYFRHDGKLVFTGRSRPIDFETLSQPPRELPYLDLKKYRETAYSIGVQSKRGCAFRCAYCTYPLLQGRRLRLRSPRKVVDEIENLITLFGVEKMFFVDTVFNSPLRHARAICREIIRRKLPVRWTAWYREDHINRSFMVEAKDAGCDLFEFSPDGGSQAALNTLQKDTEIRDIRKTYRLANMMEDVRLVYNFMYNVPGETSRTIRDFYKLLFEIVAKCWRKLEYIGLSNIRIYPRTKIHEIALKQGIITQATDLLAPTFYNPPPYSAAYLPTKWARAPLHGSLTTLQRLRRG